MEILIGKHKKFFKANLHCHSTLSDGCRTPEELKAAYRARGYSVVAFTDHEHLVDNSHLNDGDFLAITSCELAIKEFPAESSLKNMRMRVCHLNFYALDPHNTVTPCYSSAYDHYVNDENRDKIRYRGEYERHLDAAGVSEMVRLGREQGFLVAYNHPSWSLERPEHYRDYEGFFAVEIYNHSCAVSGHATDEQVLDDFLRAGKQVFCTAADDNHNKAAFDAPQGDSFGGYVQIDAAALEYGEIMRALAAGDFYASTGAEIESLVRDGDTVTVRTSPAERIYLLTGSRRIGKAYAEGSPLTEATFTLSPTDGYFRIRVEDKDGHRAFSQAYPV